ncbi:hypothetical protein GCM10010168_60680 [Actinoplanes ianthinogenes]|uniref:DUF427 domain-containing protein n=1 Tax=Actinoplanes ianthinogenes TaxID=122358 RepID=A0ABM7M464_9ACTN|nr:DUF427 domain-containing protein [Actinoplanes ianthinogenes]BCJ46429.1 hypothetical protein Aiant_70860 [Actinoplanes ianthinogenes]GGR34193.1 hypothetical protein GCM10010168_60680 [Actinoplanes ianthinogenes]
MTERPKLVPGPDHPITVTPTGKRVVVTVAGKVVADTVNALSLKEATYPVVHYVPLADVDRSLLERSTTQTYCGYKGDATYYSIPIGGDRSVDAIWEYREPSAAVAQIKDHVAFYPDRVDEIKIG